MAAPGPAAAGDAARLFDALFRPDPVGVGTASPLGMEDGADPLGHPASLPDRTAETRVWGIYDDQFDLGSGDYRGSRGSAWAAEGRHLEPVETRRGRLGLGAGFRWAESRFRVERDGGTGVGLRGHDVAPTFRAAAGWAPRPWLSAGAGFEVVTAGDARKALSAEARARAPATGTVLAYRSVQRAFGLDLVLVSDDTTARIPEHFRDRMDEVTVSQPLPGGWGVAVRRDLQDDGIWSWRAGRDGKRLALVAGAGGWTFHDAAPVIGDDGSTGDVGMRLAGRAAYGALRWRTAGGWRLTAGVRRTRLSANGSGTLAAGDFLSTLNRLLAGRRIFVYDGAATLRQYQVGLESPRERRWGWAAGLQVMDIAPRAHLTHWTPPPLIPIGRLDEQTETLNLTRAWFAALGLGLTWRGGAGEWALALAQPLPLASREAGGGGTSAGVGGGGGGRNWGGTRALIAWRRPF